MQKAVFLALPALGKLSGSAVVAQPGKRKNAAEPNLRRQQSPRPAGTGGLFDATDQINRLQQRT